MIYIGKFLHTSSQQKRKESGRRHGEFHLIVSAADQKEALVRFKERIAEMQTTTDFFEGASAVYPVQPLGTGLPDGWVPVTVCRQSGLPAGARCPKAETAWFAPDQVPATSCQMKH